MGQTKASKSNFAVYILGFMSVVFSLVGAVFLYFTYDFIANARATTGTVMSVSANYSDGSTTYKPRIAFIDANGIKQTGETFLSSSSYNYPRGTKLQILYDSRASQKLRMDSWFSLWGFPLIFLVIGLGMTFITIIVVRVKNRRKPESSSSSASPSPAPQKPEKQYSYSSNNDRSKREPTVRRR